MFLVELPIKVLEISHKSNIFPKSEMFITDICKELASLAEIIYFNVQNFKSAVFTLRTAHIETWSGQSQEIEKM